jgi:replicative DNA helicase
MNDGMIMVAPHSLESEQALLGGLFIDIKAYDKITGIVTEQDFYTLDHRKIFRAISRLVETSQPVDVVTVAEFLQGHRQLDEIGGLAYLANLSGSTPGGGANIQKYAEIVRESALKRSLITASNDIAEKVHSPTGLSGRELLDFAQAKVMSISEKAMKHTGGPQHVGSVLDGVLRRMDELGSRKTHDDVTGLSTGFTELDKMTTGMQAGELIVIAARPAMGKTALALNIVEHVALEKQKNVAFFSLEMANDQLGVRMLSSAAKMNQQRVKVGRLNDAEWGKVHTASNRLREAGIYLDEEGSLSANELRSRARSIHRECGGLHLVVVDYLQLMQTSGRSDNRAQEVAEISRALKLLAKSRLPTEGLSSKSWEEFAAPGAPRRRGCIHPPAGHRPCRLHHSPQS